MQIQVKAWGNSHGIRIPKDILRSAGIAEGDSLEIEAKKGMLILKKTFVHKTLEERCTEYNGKLCLVSETERDEPKGREVW